MKKTVWTRSFGYSDNLKSKTCPFDVLRAGSEISRRIENPKWLGFWVFALVLVVTGIAAHAQQPKVHRIGYLSGRGSSPPGNLYKLCAISVTPPLNTAPQIISASGCPISLLT
jgi:hypothetical protein